MSLCNYDAASKMSQTQFKNKLCACYEAPRVDVSPSLASSWVCVSSHISNWGGGERMTCRNCCLRSLSVPSCISRSGFVPAREMSTRPLFSHIEYLTALSGKAIPAAWCFIVTDIVMRAASITLRFSDAISTKWCKKSHDWRHERSQYCATVFRRDLNKVVQKISWLTLSRAQPVSRYGFLTRSQQCGAKNLVTDIVMRATSITLRFSDAISTKWCKNVPICPMYIGLSACKHYGTDVRILITIGEFH
jgi:hypothetical protein